MSEIYNMHFECTNNIMEMHIVRRKRKEGQYFDLENELLDTDRHLRSVSIHSLDERLREPTQTSGIALF